MIALMMPKMKKLEWTVNSFGIATEFSLGDINSLHKSYNC